MICEEAICRLCVYADGPKHCTKEPHSDLRDGIVASQGYCRYFECKYEKEGLCKKNQ